MLHLSSYEKDYARSLTWLLAVLEAAWPMIEPISWKHFSQIWLLSDVMSTNVVYYDSPARSTHTGTVEAFKFHSKFPLLAVSLSLSSSADSVSGVVSIFDQNVSLFRLGILCIPSISLHFLQLLLLCSLFRDFLFLDRM